MKIKRVAVILILALAVVACVAFALLPEQRELLLYIATMVGTIMVPVCLAAYRHHGESPSPD